jgi:carbamoyl-phosphate synthase small subunit
VIRSETIAKLALEDGTVYQGISIGAEGEIDGEVVFNTSMTGYQEILTDPSYRGQIVTMTYPMIGNYGINTDDVESPKPQISGFVVREASRVQSNFRSNGSLQDYLKKHQIKAIAGIDTRALVRRIRNLGAMRGTWTTLPWLQKRSEALGLSVEIWCVKWYRNKPTLGTKNFTVFPELRPALLFKLTRLVRPLKWFASTLE